MRAKHLISVCLGLAVAVAGAKTVYVDGNCGDDAWAGSQRSCGRPNGPKRTIGAALLITQAGDTVLIGEGIYKEHDLDLAERALTIRSAGGSSNCVIDCGYQGRAFVAPAQGHDTVFEDLTIRRAGRLWGPYLNGGAIDLGGASPTFRTCVFEGCEIHGHGSAIYGEGGAPVILGCSFYRNMALLPDGRGGSVEVVNGAALVRDCWFENTDPLYVFGGITRVERCTFYGSALTGTAFAARGPGVVVTQCLVTGIVIRATAREGATIEQCKFLELPGEALRVEGALVRDCVFEGNVPPLGAIRVGGSSAATIERCRFVRNEGIQAGAIGVLEGGSAIVVDCEFLLNEGLNDGGAVQVKEGLQLVAINCAFRGNFAAGRGGAIGLKSGASATLINCVLDGNGANFTTGGVYAPSDASVNIVNSIIWANTADTTGLPAQLTGPITVNHSCVQDWDGSLGGVGNFGADPGFVEPLGPDGLAGTGDENLLLQPSSPCIDAGDSAAIEPYATLDLTGRPRFFDDLATPDTGVPSSLGATVDLGPTEYLGWEALRPGDMNCDGAITPADVNLFVSALRYPNGQGWPGNCPWLHADLDGDGRVTFADISILRAWLTP